MVAWIKEQWKQIRGHVKFRLVELAGAGMIASLGAVLHKAFKNLDKEWIVFGCLFLFSALTLFLILRRQQRPDYPSALGRYRATASSMPPPPMIASPQPGIDITILELVIQRKPSPFGGFGGLGGNQGYSVFLSLRLTNHDHTPVAIVGWELEIIFNSVRKGYLNTPTGINVVATKTSFTSVTMKGSTPFTITQIDVADGTTVLTIGKPHTGWIRFETYSWEGKDNPTGGQLVLSLRDSLKREHVGTFDAQPYIDKYEVVAMDEPS